jgi:hypothetical protein
LASEVTRDTSCGVIALVLDGGIRLVTCFQITADLIGLFSSAIVLIGSHFFCSFMPVFL